MGVFAALLPLILWIALFVLSIVKHKFNKIIFVICFSFAFVLNLASFSWNGISMELLHILISCIGQTLMLYVIVDFIHNMIEKRRKAEKRG